MRGFEGLFSYFLDRVGIGAVILGLRWDIFSVFVSCVFIVFFLSFYCVWSLVLFFALGLWFLVSYL